MNKYSLFAAIVSALAPLHNTELSSKSFSIGSATCAIPRANNRCSGVAAARRAARKRKAKK